MKYFLMLSLIICASRLFAQTFYKSSKGSYQQNYYIELKSDSATLYGWEVRLQERDTIYFKATGPIGKAGGSITLTNYKFSKVSPVSSKFNYPLPEDESLIHTAVLHKYITIQESKKRLMKVHMAKDMYDSRLDVFMFTKIE